MLDISELRRSRPIGREQQEKLHKDLGPSPEEKKSQPRRMPTRAK